MPAGSGKVRVPHEVAPVKLPHPEAVEVEHLQREVALGHAVDEFGDRLLVVLGGERGAQPQPERPGRRQRGPAGESGVLVEDFCGRGPIDHQIFQCFAGHTELTRDTASEPISNETRPG